MTSITTIIFDLGGVLIDYDLQRCIDSFKALGYLKAEQMLNPYTQAGIMLRLDSGLADREELYEDVCRTVGHTVAPQQIDCALCNFLLTIPLYKLDMLRDLRRNGYRILMLSNTNQIMMDHIRSQEFTKQGLSIDDYFDRTFLSYQMKMVKPHAEIYQKMIQEATLTPSECLFIDDAAANIAAARPFGFNTYQATIHEDFRPLFAHYPLLSR